MLERFRNMRGLCKFKMNVLQLQKETMTDDETSFVFEEYLKDYFFDFIEIIDFHITDMQDSIAEADDTDNDYEVQEDI